MEMRTTTRFCVNVVFRTLEELRWFKELEALSDAQNRDDEVPATSRLSAECVAELMESHAKEHRGCYISVDDDRLGVVWSTSSGDRDYAAKVLQHFLRQHRPVEAFGFKWVTTTDPIEDTGTEGGAVFVTTTEIVELNTTDWINNQFNVRGIEQK